MKAGRTAAILPGTRLILAVFTSVVLHEFGHSEAASRQTGLSAAEAGGDR